MSKKCVHPYVGISLTGFDGKLRPCCIYKDQQIPTIFEIDTLDGIHSQKPYKSIQKKLSSSTLPDGCRICKRHEDTGLRSKRIESNSIHQNKFDVSGYVEDLEIAIDYTCNMMCRMCSPRESSKWGAAHEVIEKFNEHGLDDINFNSRNYKKYQDQFFKVFSNTNLKYVKNVKLQGGEPFYAKNFEWFLDKLYNELDDKSKTKLSIFSNGSIFPNDNILEKLKGFKTEIVFSIDAYGDLASVLRYGVNWDIVESNLVKWAEFAKQNNIILLTNTTLSILNVNMIEPLSKFCKQLGIKMNFNELRYPTHFSMYQLPLSIRNQWKGHAGHASFDRLLLVDIEHDQEFEKFFKATEILDSYQGLKFKDANPEMYEIIKNLSI